VKRQANFFLSCIDISFTLALGTLVTRVTRVTLEILETLETFETPVTIKMDSFAKTETPEKIIFLKQKCHFSVEKRKMCHFFCHSTVSYFILKWTVFRKMGHCVM
jgi:hypothetical protein